MAVRPSLLRLALGEHVAPAEGALLKGSFELPAGVGSWHKPIPGGTSCPHSPKEAAQGWGLGDHPAQGHHLAPQKPTGDGRYCAPTAAPCGHRNRLMVGLDLVCLFNLNDSMFYLWMWLEGMVVMGQQLDLEFFSYLHDTTIL